MNKRLNSILFIIAATIANIVVMMVLFLVLTLLYAQLLAPRLSPGTNQFVLLVLFVGSVIATYIIYHRVMKWASARYALEEHFVPLFGSSHRRPGE